MDCMATTIFVSTVAGLLMSILGFVEGTSDGKEMVFKQAYDRGYAVQCVGKTGYYWECEK